MRFRITPPPKYTAIVTALNREIPLSIFMETDKGPLPLAAALFTTREKTENHLKKHLKMSTGKIVEIGKDISCTDYFCLLSELIRTTFENLLKEKISPEETVAFVFKWPMAVNPERQFGDKKDAESMPILSDLFTKELIDANQDNLEIEVLHEKGFTIFLSQNQKDKDFVAAVFEGQYSSRDEVLARKHPNCAHHFTSFYETKKEAEMAARQWIDRRIKSIKPK